MLLNKYTFTHSSREKRNVIRSGKNFIPVDQDQTTWREQIWEADTATPCGLIRLQFLGYQSGTIYNFHILSQEP